MRCLISILCVCLCQLAISAEGGASITPAPGFEPPKAGTPPPVRTMPPMMGRPSMSYEVEVVQLKPGDMAALSRWTALAAVGFHVVATVPGDGQATLLLERGSMAGAPEALRIPDGIDGESARALRGRLEAEMAERMRQSQPPRPAPVAPASGGKP